MVDDQIVEDALILGNHYAYYPTSYRCIWRINGLTCKNDDGTEVCMGVARHPGDGGCWLMTFNSDGSPDSYGWISLGKNDTIRGLDNAIYKKVKALSTQ